MKKKKDLLIYLAAENAVFGLIALIMLIVYYCSIRVRLFLIFIFLLVILFFFNSCKKQQSKTIRDTLVIHDSVTRKWELKRIHDTIHIRNNTIIHTQDTGCKSTIKIITDRVKEYLPSTQKNEIATNFLPKEIKIFVWVLGGLLIFGMVLATILLIALIKRK